MEAVAKKLTIGKSEVVCGHFSKIDAAKMIASGARHIHSSTLGQKDSCVKVTREYLGKRKISPYPWEKFESVNEVILNSSSDRTRIIQEILTQAPAYCGRELKEKFESVLEELLTNSIYHAYRNKDGTPKYPRRHQVTLANEEAVKIAYACNKAGAFLSVTDQGGYFPATELARSFSRCYSEKHSRGQIEDKEGGAGLGLYMIYEAVTHLKIELFPRRRTIISCWIADRRSYHPDIFSFNLFERR